MEEKKEKREIIQKQYRFTGIGFAGPCFYVAEMPIHVFEGGKKICIKTSKSRVVSILGLHSLSRPTARMVDCPVWVLAEILAFKDFLRFTEYYVHRHPERVEVNFKLLNTVRNLRNACAHNNCILTSLRPGVTKPTATVSQRVSKIPTIAKEERKNKLSCRPLFEIVCLLMEYEHWVSEPLRSRRLAELQRFAHGRMISHVKFFEWNQTISTSIAFLQKTIDNFTKNAYTK